MVTLFVSDTDQLTMLEYELIKANIPYKMEVTESNFGISPPSLRVHGVPLDMKRSLNWIKENSANG